VPFGTLPAGILVLLQIGNSGLERVDCFAHSNDLDPQIITNYV